MPPRRTLSRIYLSYAIHIAAFTRGYSKISLFYSASQNEISEKILLHAAAIPAPHHSQFMKNFRKHLSDKFSFNTIKCFLEEAAPNWRERVQQNYEEAQKTPTTHR